MMWQLLPRLFSAVVGMVVFSGCVNYTYRYVVRAEAPKDPSVTVIPMSATPGDRAAADRVMTLLVGNGVKVKLPPAIVQTRTETKGNTQAQAALGTWGGGLAIGGGGTQTSSETQTVRDALALVDETDADYVFLTRADSGREPFVVQVVRRRDRQVLYVGYVTDSPDPGAPWTWGGKDERLLMRELLSKLGIVESAWDR